MSTGEASTNPTFSFARRKAATVNRNRLLRVEVSGKSDCNFRRLVIWDDPSLRSSRENLWAPSHRIRKASITSHKSADEVFADFHYYTRAGWDGEDALPITEHTLQMAYDLIDKVLLDEPPPDPAPAANGSIGLEWWNGDARLFIDVGPDAEVRTYLNLGEGAHSEELFQWGQAELKGVLKRLFTRLYGRRVESGGTWRQHFEDLSYGSPDDLESADLLLTRTYGFAPSPIESSTETAEFIIVH